MKLQEAQTKLLRRFFLFAPLSEEEFHKVLLDLTVSAYRGGETIFSPESFERSLGIVLEGKVEVTGKGGLLLRVIEKGECFGAAALFGEEKERYFTTLTAHLSCKVIFLTGDQLEDLFAVYPSMAKAYIAFLSGRIRFLNRRIENLTRGTAEEKLWYFLCGVEDREGKVEVSGGFSKLARSLSMSRASLYRLLDKLEDKGRLRKEGNILYLCHK